ncbi:MAG: hypothetical protein JW940_00170 [Polyangiaceae bacterium]|nr:hypothetical protein [Polyangiaceae bacterium]
MNLVWRWRMGALLVLSVGGGCILCFTVGTGRGQPRTDAQVSAPALRGNQDARADDTRILDAAQLRHILGQGFASAAEEAARRVEQEAQPETDMDDETQVHAPEPVEVAREAIRNGVIRGFPVSEVPHLFDRMMADEPADAAWTEQMAHDVGEALLASEAQGSSVKEVTCSKTICRIVTSHGSSDDAREFWHWVGKKAAWSGPGHRFTEPMEGGVESTYYMARRGNDERVHDALYDRIYGEVTGKEVGSIDPTDEQIREALALAESAP